MRSSWFDSGVWSFQQYGRTRKPSYARPLSQSCYHAQSTLSMNVVSSVL